MTPQESWNYIEKQLEEIGKLDQVDMEKEVRGGHAGAGVG